MRAVTTPAPRAKPGQGRATLQAAAITAATALGHLLGRFHAAEGKSVRAATVVVGNRLIAATVPQVFRARCDRCGLTAIIDQHAWVQDKKGFGGRATSEACQESKEGTNG
jgi:hypothetical protein